MIGPDRPREERAEGLRVVIQSASSQEGVGVPRYPRGEVVPRDSIPRAQGQSPEEWDEEQRQAWAAAQPLPSIPTGRVCRGCGRNCPLGNCPLWSNQGNHPDHQQGGLVAWSTYCALIGADPKPLRMGFRQLSGRPYGFTTEQMQRYIDQLATNRRLESQGNHRERAQKMNQSRRPRSRSPPPRHRGSVRIQDGDGPEMERTRRSRSRERSYSGGSRSRSPARRGTHDTSSVERHAS